MARLVAGVAVLLGLLAATAGGTTQGKNGGIVFERLRFQNRPWGELYVTNPAGTGVRRVTRPPNGWEDVNPRWSPDGSRIAFERVPPEGAHAIWVVRADGTGLRRISPPCPRGHGIPSCAADDGWPAWSPDGRQLVFQRLAGALRPAGATVSTAQAIERDELVIAATNGRHARVLLWLGRWRGDPQAPTWSPDGKRIAFIGKYMTSGDNGSGCECRAVYVIDADGAHLHRITKFGLRPGGRPDWSPDGTTILFRTHPTDDPSGTGSNLYIVRPDGTQLRALTHFGAGERVLEGSYSPDGSSVVFETSHGAVGGTFPDLFVMNADGTGMHRLIGTRTFETTADWGPG